MSTEARAKALLSGVVRRSDAKRLAPELDADPDLRLALVSAARAAGVELPDEAHEWPGKKLLRRALGREASSRVRTNPVARDESFACAHCHADVVPARRTARDHCPRCLHSQHVDEAPGDRAATCHGLLVPVDAERRGEGFRIRYRCARCGAERFNKALLDVHDPDDWEALVSLTARMDPRGRSGPEGAGK